MRRCASKYLRYTMLRLSANIPCANKRGVAAKTMQICPAVKNSPLSPMAVVDSIDKSGTMKPDVLVEVLKKERNSMKIRNSTNIIDKQLATNAQIVIDRTIPLVEAGDARGKQQALLVLALLINGAGHGGMMKKLKEAASCKDSVAAARFQELLATFAPPDSKAEFVFSQASERDIYDVTGLEKMIPKEGVNVVIYLEQQKLLTESKFFKGRKIWRLTNDQTLDRHIGVELMSQDATVEIVRGIMYERAALLYGESGSGKTSTAILSCEEGDLCIFMTPRMFANGQLQMARFDSKLKADREAFSRKYNELNKGRDSGIVIPDMPGAVCKALKGHIRKTIPYYESLEDFPGNVVIVVDEVGSNPRLVRALCRERSSIVREVKEALKVTGDVGLVVCGTGCESGDDSLGSYPSTFEALRCEPKPFQKHVIKLMAKKGFVALAELLNSRQPTRASYYHKMSIDPKSLEYLRRLMLNRRFCAALLSELSRSFADQGTSGTTQRNPSLHISTLKDDKIPWLTVLPVYASSALLTFKRVNGLQKLSWDATSALFARALAYCFGGAHQVIDGAADLQRKFGMITDNARECDSDQVDVCISKLSDGKQLALPKDISSLHHGRRAQMSAAMAEMGLQRFSLSTVARARTEAAFESTIMDWIYCWCLACCSDVPTITLLGEKYDIRKKERKIEPVELAQDVDALDGKARQAVLTMMMNLRDVLRASQPKTAVVLRVTLTAKVAKVAEAEAAAFAEAWTLIGEEDVPFVLVAQNVSRAPFADVFIVAGRTCKPFGSGITTAFVAIQVKHYTNSSFHITKADDEHTKHGAGESGTTGFNSLVLVLHANDRNDLKAPSVVGDKTTVWIRSDALASVMHPISLGADPPPNGEAPRSSWSEKCDLRKQKR